MPSIGGLILFGKIPELQYYFPDARVSCARFVGDNNSNILDRLEIDCDQVAFLKESFTVKKINDYIYQQRSISPDKQHLIMAGIKLSDQMVDLQAFLKGRSSDLTVVFDHSSKN